MLQLRTGRYCEWGRRLLPAKSLLIKCLRHSSGCASTPAWTWALQSAPVASRELMMITMFLLMAGKCFKWVVATDVSSSWSCVLLGCMWNPQISCGFRWAKECAMKCYDCWAYRWFAYDLWPHKRQTVHIRLPQLYIWTWQLHSRR